MYRAGSSEFGVALMPLISKVAELIVEEWESVIQEPVIKTRTYVEKRICSVTYQ